MAPDRSAALAPSGIRGLLRGALATVRGLGRIARDARIRRLALAPIAIAAVLYAAFAVGAGFAAPALLGEFWTAPAGGWLGGLWVLVAVLVWAGLLLALAMIMMALLNVIAGPFYDRIAIAILRERGLPTREPPFLEGLGALALRALLIWVPGVGAAALGLVPGIGGIFWAIAAALGWIALAAESFEPTLAAAGLRPIERVLYVYRFPLLSLGLGGVLGLTLAIPLLPLLTLPAAVVGAAQCVANDRTFVGRRLG